MLGRNFSKLKKHLFHNISGWLHTFLILLHGVSLDRITREMITVISLMISSKLDIISNGIYVMVRYAL